MVQKGHYWRQVKDFLERQGAYDDFNNLGEALERVDPKRRVEEFLSLLSSVGTETFVAIEGLVDSWQGRLARLGRQGILRFDHTTLDMREIVHDLRTGKINQALARHRKPLDANASFRNLRDSVALAMLARRIDEYQPDASGVAIFYTDTDAVRRAVSSDAELAELLCYPSAGPSLTAAEGAETFTVLRDENYFLVRAYFASLSFSTLEQRTQGVATIATFEDLDLEQVVHPANADLTPPSMRSCRK